MPVAEKTKFEVGQKLIAVYRQIRQADQVCEIVVESVGRKWVMFDFVPKGCRFIDRKFNRQTLAIDGHGYSSPGRVYLSRADYDAEIERRQLLATLRDNFTGYGDPDYLTLDHLRRMVAIASEQKGATNGDR